MTHNPSFLPFTTKSLPSPGDFVVADTSFIFNLMGENNSSIPGLQAECQNFVKMLADNGISFATTIKTHEELRIKLTSSMVGGPHKRKRVLAANPQAMLPVVQRVAEIQAALEQLTNYYPEPVGQVDARLLADVDKLMGLGLQHGDAVIYLLSKREDINHIISLDGDFTLIEDGRLTVYTSEYRYNQLVRRPRPGLTMHVATNGDGQAGEDSL